MKNKVIKSENTKIKNIQMNDQKEIDINNPFTSDPNTMSKHRSHEFYNQNSQKNTSNSSNPTSSNNSNKNTTLTNTIKQVSNNNGKKNKNKKKTNNRHSQCNEAINYYNLKNEIEKNNKDGKNISDNNEEKNESKKSGKNKQIEKKVIEEDLFSENNLIQIKNNKKKALNKIFSETDSFHDIDSIEDDNSKESYRKNSTNALLKISLKDENNKEGKLQITNLKANHNNPTKKNGNERKSNIRTIFDGPANDKKEENPFKTQKNKEKKGKDDSFDDVIINESEFDNSRIIQTNNIEKTQFPKISLNPFSANSSKVNNLKIKKEEEKDLDINHHLKSSTLITNAKTSTTNPNSSNLSSTIEINSNQNTASKKENNNINYSPSEIEQKKKDLLLLAKRGDREKFVELFDEILSLPKNLVDINYQDENGFTPLHYACDEGNLKIVEILLNSKCDTNIQNNQKETPLHLASKRGYYDISKKLVENGASINIYNSDKNSPLHYACMYNYVELVNYFLTKSPNVDVKNINDKMPIELTTNKEIKELLEKYLIKKDNKNKIIKEFEISEAFKRKRSKSPDNEVNIVNDNNQFDSDRNIINIKNKNVKSKNTFSPLKNENNKKIRKNSEFDSIPDPLDIVSKRKYTLNKKNVKFLQLNAINNNFENNEKNKENNIIELKNSKKLNTSINKNNQNKNINKKNVNSVLRKSEFKGSEKENPNNIKKAQTENLINNQNKNNVIQDKINNNRKSSNTLNENENNSLANENKSTKMTEKLSSSILSNKNKGNKSNLYNSINRRKYTVYESRKKNLNIQDSMNNGHNRLNLSGNKDKDKDKERNNVNKSFNKNNGEIKTVNTVGNKNTKSKFCENNLKTYLTTNSINSSNNNLLNSNKIEENLKYDSKTQKVSSKNNNFTNMKYINCNPKQFESTEKILTKVKSKTNRNKLAKTNKEKNTDSIFNISRLSCRQHRNNVLLDKVNKSNIVDKTLGENVYNKLNLNSIEEDKITPSSFLCLAQLGKGSFGEVYLVQKINTKEKYAMKVLRKDRIIGHNLLKYAIAERNVLSLSHHPFIVKLYFTFQTSSKLFLILEYCPNGDLSKHLLFEKRFSEKRAKFYLCEVLLALENLHKRDVIFRDLKPDNVVLDEEGHCKLTDFGLSKEGVSENQYAQSFCGSIAYLAPEMLKKKGHGKAVDWYLLGVLFYEMLVGITPYFTLRKEDIFQNIEHGELKIPEFVSNEAATLLRALLERDPKKRLGGGPKDAQEIKEHPYFKDVDWNQVYNKKLKPPTFINYINKTIHYYHKPRLFANEDLLNKSSDKQDPNKLFGWSFINNEEL